MSSPALPVLKKLVAYLAIVKSRKWPKLPITLWGEQTLLQEQGRYANWISWRKTIVVIGHEDFCGDPLFVDLADAHLAVCICMHDDEEGFADASAVATNPMILLECIELVNSALEGHRDRAEAIAAIARLNSSVEVDMEFWQVFLEED